MMTQSTALASKKDIKKHIGIENNQAKKDQIVRNRKIYSCKRCFKGKRKCDKTKPSCIRCQKAHVPCEYFTKRQIDERFYDRQENTVGTPLNNNVEIIENNTNNTDNNTDTDKPVDLTQTNNVLQNNTEINPQTENQNFTVIVSSTGEYSKFFPTCFFSYYDHAENVSMVLNYGDIDKNIPKSLAIFDFSQIVNPINSLNEIKLKIPEKEMSDILIDHFFKFIAPFVPIVDAQEFIYEYNKFWENIEEFQDMNFLVVMFAIYFCSCTNIGILMSYKKKTKFSCLDDKRLIELNHQNLRNTCFECIENLRRMLRSNSTPSLSIIIGLTLIYYLGSANGYAISIQVTTLVKYVQIFGLHRKLITESNDLPMRDIIYSFVWYLDGLSAYYSGFPPDMHYDFFECENIYNLASNDIHMLFLSARLCNTLVWNRLLFEFNKIGKTEIHQFEEVETLYLNSITIVNSINKKILKSNDKNLRYRKWLTTETRLGLRKSMLLVSALKYSISYKPFNFYNRNLTTDLVLQAMLLINESVYKVKLGMIVLKEAFWFYRFAIPFQAMYIVISHLQKYPNQHLNFSILDKELEYTDDQCVDLNYTSGDLRLNLVDVSIKNLNFLTEFWHPTKVERFERLIKFRDYVWENNLNISAEFTSSNSKKFDSKNVTNDLNDNIYSHNNIEKIDNSNYEKDFIKQRNFNDLNLETPLDEEVHVDNQLNENLNKRLNNFDNYISTGLENSKEFGNNDYYDAYAFLDDGSKFWFGEDT
ncbi:hypothetical protein C6P40_003118 [Pichia californica]|uniref:Zn(2)-C6 fungal-type domain-containing protein n=1 Tax=Pichia californica TaxID=460514 RepID=A0A9P7BDK2_9ASCO|nr:hypothetical protein C6P40_003118 [[Candida] californica]